MNDDRWSQITANQAKALRRFDIPEAKIQALSKKEASELLTQLIEQARTNPGRKHAYHKGDGTDAVTETKGTFSEATKVVMEHFGLKDMSDLTEAHVALIQEAARQIYGLKYWIGKSNGFLKPNGD